MRSEKGGERTVTIKEAIKLLATAKRQLINGWVYKLVKPPDAKEIIKLLEEQNSLMLALDQDLLVHALLVCVHPALHF